ncbi:MAG: hypothetical protein VKM97_01020 [Cyanobacteriota bacterium]|nr:hypothetical protein [Cyanobacteriota bacterium]
MLAFLALLPRALVTFLYALSAFLRFFAPSLPADELLPILPRAGTDQALPALLGWSLAAFQLASAALLVDLGVEWNSRARARNRADVRRDRALRRSQATIGFQVALVGFLLKPGVSTRQQLSDSAIELNALDEMKHPR